MSQWNRHFLIIICLIYFSLYISVDTLQVLDSNLRHADEDGSLHCTFTQYYTLADCSSRNLHKVPSSLPPTVKYLILKNNRISEIHPHGFIHLPNLVYLDISFNQIKELGINDFDGLEKLESLYLTGNPLTKLEDNVFGRLTTLTEINLMDNKLVCNCEILWLMRWQRNLLSRKKRHFDISCYHPVERAQVKVFDLDIASVEDKFGCEHSRSRRKRSATSVTHWTCYGDKVVPLLIKSANISDSNTCQGLCLSQNDLFAAIVDSNCLCGSPTSAAYRLARSCILHCIDQKCTDIPQIDPSRLLSAAHHVTSSSVNASTRIESSFKLTNISLQQAMTSVRPTASSLFGFQNGTDLVLNESAVVSSKRISYLLPVTSGDSLSSSLLTAFPTGSISSLLSFEGSQATTALRNIVSPMPSLLSPTELGLATTPKMDSLAYESRDSGSSTIRDLISLDMSTSFKLKSIALPTPSTKSPLSGEEILTLLSQNTMVQANTHELSSYFSSHYSSILQPTVSTSQQLMNVRASAKARNISYEPTAYSSPKTSYIPTTSFATQFTTLTQTAVDTPQVLLSGHRSIRSISSSSDSSKSEANEVSQGAVLFKNSSSLLRNMTVVIAVETSDAWAIKYTIDNNYIVVLQSSLTTLSSGSIAVPENEMVNISLTFYHKEDELSAGSVFKNEPSPLAIRQCVSCPSLGSQWKASELNAELNASALDRNSFEIKIVDDDSSQSHVLSINFTSVEAMTSAPALITASRNYVPTFENLFYVFSSQFRHITAIWTLIGPSGGTFLFQNQSLCSEECPSGLDIEKCNSSASDCFLAMTYVLQMDGKYTIEANFTNPVTSLVFTHSFDFVAETKISQLKVLPRCDYYSNINVSKGFSASFSGSWHLIVWKINGSSFEYNRTETQYTFKELGTFNVSTYVQNNLNDASQDILITVAEAGAIHGLSIKTPSENSYHATGKNVTFEAQLCEGDNPFLSWDFRDGTNYTTNLTRVYHAFYNPSNYVVNLRANNHNTNIDTSVSVFIQDKIFNFSAVINQSIVKVNEAFRVYVSISKGTGVTYYISTKEFMIQFTGNASNDLRLGTAGDAHVNITARNEVSKAIVSLAVTVQELIILHLRDIYYFGLNMSSTIEAYKTSGTHMNVKWNFGDESHTNSTYIEYGNVQVTHLYTIEGNYTLLLYAENNVTANIKISSIVFVERALDDKNNMFFVNTKRHVATNDTFNVNMSVNHTSVFGYNISCPALAIDVRLTTHSYVFLRSLQFAKTYHFEFVASNNVSIVKKIVSIVVQDRIAGKISVSPAYVPWSSTVETQLNATVQGTDPVFQWRFPNGDSLNGSNIDYAFSQLGPLFVNITARNEISSVTSHILIYVERVLNDLSLNTNATIAAVNNPVLFNSSIPFRIEHIYTWAVDDVIVNNNGDNLVWTFGSIGYHSVVLSLRNNISICRSSVAVMIQEPVADIELMLEDNLTVIPFNESVSVRARVASGSNMTFAWNVGSLNNVSSLDFYSVLVDTLSPYYVEVFVKVFNNVSIKIAKRQFSVVQRIDGVDILTQSRHVIANTKVSFQLQYSFGSNFSITWRINNNTVSTDAYMNYSFPRVGSYNVSIALKNILNSKSHHITVNVYDRLDMIDIRPKIAAMNQSTSFEVTDVDDLETKVDWIIPENVIFTKVSSFKVNMTFQKPSIYFITLNLTNKAHTKSKIFSIKVQTRVSGLQLFHEKNFYQTNMDVFFNATVFDGTNVTFLWAVDSQSEPVKESKTIGSFKHFFSVPGRYGVKVIASNLVSSSAKSVTVFVQRRVVVMELYPYKGGVIPTDANISLTAVVNGTNVTVSFLVPENVTVLKTSSANIVFRVQSRGHIWIGVNATNEVSHDFKKFPFLTQTSIKNVSLWTSARVIPVRSKIDFQAISYHGSDMTYQWFINGTVIPNETNFLLRHSFLVIGTYRISVFVSNKINVSEAYVFIYVEPIKCTPPVVKIAGGKRRELIKSQWLYSESSIKSNCSLWSVNSKWSIRTATHSTNCLLDVDTLHPFLFSYDVDLNSPLLAIQPRSFDDGFYCLYYTATYGMGGKFRIYDATQLKVVPSSPVPILTSGELQYYGTKQSFILDATQSIDPDGNSKKDFLYSWGCIILVAKYDNQSFDHAGCRNKSWSKEASFSVSAGSLVQGFTYEFTMSVKKAGGMPASTSQQAVIVAENRLSLLLTCITCRSYKTKKYVRNRSLKLVGSCKDCSVQSQVPFRLLITWLVTSSNGDIILNVSKSSSEASDILMIKENTLDGVSSYAIKFAAVTQDRHMIKGESVFSLEPNEPPSNGSCEVQPLEGVTLQTEFSFQCKDFKDVDNVNSPLLYWLQVQNVDGSWSILYRGIQSFVSMYLPVGNAMNERKLRLQILVEDVFGAVSVGLDREVRVSPPVVDDIGKFLEDNVVASLDLLTRENDLNKVVGISTSSAALINGSSRVGTKEVDILSSVTKSASSMRASSLENVGQLSSALKFTTELVTENSFSSETRKQLTRSLENMINKVEDFASEGQLAYKKSLEALLFLSQNNIAAGKSQGSRRRRRSAPLQLLNATQVRKNLNLVMKIYTSVLRASIPGEDATAIFNKYGAVVLKRGKSSSVNKTLTVDGCSFFIKNSPGSYEDLFQILNTTYVDPFSTSSIVQSKIAGLSFTMPNGTEIAIKDLRVNESVLMNIDGNRKSGTNITSKIIAAKGEAEGELTFDFLYSNTSTIIFEVIVNDGERKDLKVFLSRTKNTFDAVFSLMNSSSNGNFVKHFSPRESKSTDKYYIKIGNTGEKESLNITVLLYTVSCIFWDRQNKMWSSEGLTLTNETNFYQTVCRSSHLTSFASTFKIAPNPIKWSTLSELDIEKNPIAMALCLTIIVLYFLCLFFASRKDEDDRHQAQYIPLMGADEYFKYEIRIKTGAFPGAGTSANIGIQIFASKCTTKPIVLAKEGGFQRNSIELFRFSSPTRLGKILRLRIWHDNSGSGPSWYLTRIVIKNLLNGQKFFFFCNRWLAVDRDDGEIERVFDVADAKTMAKFKTIFNDVVGRTFTDYHIWISIFEKPKLSRFTRVQRLTCCVTFLLSWMCVDAMWYGQVREGKIDLYIGLKGYSYEDVIVGIISSLMVFPTNFLLVLIFRNRRLPKARRVLDGDDEVAIHVLPNSRRTRRLSEDWVEIEDFTEGTNPLFATSLPRCGGYFRLSVYQPIVALNENRKMYMENLSDPDEENDDDEMLEYSEESSRAVVTYNKKLSRVHSDQDRFPETSSVGMDDSFSSRFKRMNSHTYSRVPVSYDVSDDIYDPRFHLTRQRSSSCGVSTVSTLQTRLTTTSSRKLSFSNTNEDLECISSFGSESKSGSGRNIQERIKKASMYQNTEDSFSSSRHSSRFNSSSTARTLRFSRNLAKNEEDSLDKNIPDIRELHSNLECLLPSWFVVVGYFGCFSISVVSLMVILIYGHEFGKDKALSWLTSIFAGLLQDIFITYPVLLFFVAILIALIRKPMNLDYGDFVTCPVVPGDATASSKPVRGYALELAQKQGRGRREIRRIVKNLLFQLLHLWIVLSICVTGYEANRWVVQQKFESEMASGKKGIQDVNSINKLWIWADKDFSNFLFPEATSNEDWVLTSTPRMRQVRIHPTACPFLSAVRTINMSESCNPEFSSDHMEIRNFTSDWNKSGKSGSNEWLFREKNSINGTQFLGRLGLYPVSGYVATLGRGKPQFLSNVARLKSADWLDARTRAVFIEFVMQNININRYIVTTVTFEFSSTGLVLPSIEMIYLRVHMYVSRLDYFRLFCEVIFGLLTFYFLWQIQDKLRRNGCEFFKKSWNVHLLFSFLASISAIGLYIYRLVIFLDLRPFLKKGIPRGYDLRHEAIIDWSIKACMGLVCFLLILKILSLLSWTRAYRLTALTLRRAAKHLCTLFFGLLLVLTAFASWGYLAFGSNCYYFHSFWTSILYTFLIRNRHDKDIDPTVKSSGYYIAWSILYRFILLAFVFSLFKAAMCTYFKDAKILYLSCHEKNLKVFLKYLYNKFVSKKKKSGKRVKFSLNPSVRRNTLGLSQQTISLGSDQWLSSHSLISYSHIPSLYKERVMSRLNPSTDEILQYVHQLEHDEILEDEFYSRLESLANASRSKRLHKIT